MQDGNALHFDGDLGKGAEIRHSKVKTDKHFVVDVNRSRKKVQEISKRADRSNRALESDQQSPRASRMSRTEENLRREAEAELDEEWNGAGSEDDQDGERDQVMADTDADEDMQDEEMSDSDEEPQKDEVELELEKEVFGDEAGFLDEINRYSEQVAGASAREDDNALAGIQDSELWFTDAGTDEPRHLVTDEDDDEHLTAYSREPPAWEDSDDERISVSLMAVPRLRKLRTFEGEDVISGQDFQRRLRRQYETLHPTPAWAQWIPEPEMDDDDDKEDYSTQPLAKLMRSTESLTRGVERLSNKRVKLKPEVIAIERMKDISPTQPHAIVSLSIHPALPLLLSAGLSSTVFLHHLHPRPTPPDPANPLITSLHLKHTPLHTAAFSPRPTTDTTSSTDPKIYLSGRRRYFHTWNLPSGQITKTTRLLDEQASTQRSFETIKPSPCGRYIALKGTSKKGGGVVNLLDANTSQWIAQAKIDSKKGVADFVWWSDGRGLTILGVDGEVTEWSADERRVLCRWNDEGQIGATVISLGGKHPAAINRKKRAPPMTLGPDRYVATGSSSGIVNVYDRSTWLSNPDDEFPPSNPTPLRALNNLTTAVSHVCFSPDGQLLAISSRVKRDALKLVHMPSCTVYRNWPTSKTPLGRVSAVTLGEFTDYAGTRQGEAGARCLIIAVGNEQGALRAWEVTG